MPAPFSILVDIFYPSAGTIFLKKRGVNGHAWLRRLFQTFRLTWKWRERSSGKIAERTYERERKTTLLRKMAMLRRHLLDKVAVSDLCEELGLHRRYSTVGKKSCSRTERPPSRRRNGPIARWRRNRSGSSSWRRKCKPRRGPGRADGGAHRVKKKSWGTLTATWVPHDVRDQVVEFVRRWSEKSRSASDDSPPGWA